MSYHHNHNHNLSINSMTSIIEPTTPPNNLLSNTNSNTNSISNSFTTNSTTNNTTNNKFQQQNQQRPRTPQTSSTGTNTATNSNSTSSTNNTSYNTNHTHNRSLSFSNGFSKFNSQNLNGKSLLWDTSNKLNSNLNLPNFNIDTTNSNGDNNNNEIFSTPLIIPPSSFTTNNTEANEKIVTHNLTNSPSSSTISSFQKLSLDSKPSTTKENSNQQSNQSTIYSIDNKENFLKNLNNGSNLGNHGIGSGNVNGNSNGNGGNIINFIGDGNSNSSASTPSTTNNLNFNGGNGGNDYFKNGHGGSANGNATSTTTSTTPILIPTKIDKEYLSSINKLPLIQLKTEILKLSKDQYGCRFLQKKIDENLITSYQIRVNNFEIIFNEIYPFMYELIIDPFGNYLIQKMIPYCTELNLNLILEILSKNLFQISINQHGTRALQKIIDNLNNNLQLNLLIKGLKPYIVELIKDLNGNHVIQKILNKYKPIDCQFIYESIIESLYIVATHKHGCCVLQKCLNHVTQSQLIEFSNSILNFSNFSKLINDQFGNYVLQYLISINSIDINYKIFKNFLKLGLKKLCNSKFSSNVVEKFLKNCFGNEIHSMDFSNLKFELIYKILIDDDLNLLINDPYGNYVIQTVIDILINSQINYLKNDCKISLILPNDFNLDQLKNQQQSQSSQQNYLLIIIIKYWFQNCKIISSFGKRIQSKINIILNNNGSLNFSSSSTSSSSSLPQSSSSNSSACSSSSSSIGPLNNKVIKKSNSQMNSNGEFISSNDVVYKQHLHNQQYQPNLQQHLQSLNYLNQFNQNNNTAGLDYNNNFPIKNNLNLNIRTNSLPNNIYNYSNQLSMQQSSSNNGNNNVNNVNFMNPNLSGTSIHSNGSNTNEEHNNNNNGRTSSFGNGGIPQPPNGVAAVNNNNIYPYVNGPSPMHHPYFQQHPLPHPHQQQPPMGYQTPPPIPPPSSNQQCHNRNSSVSSLNLPQQQNHNQHYISVNSTPSFTPNSNYYNTPQQQYQSQLSTQSINNGFGYLNGFKTNNQNGKFGSGNGNIYHSHNPSWSSTTTTNSSTTNTNTNVNINQSNTAATTATTAASTANNTTPFNQNW
ncbi:MPT5 [Candida pseudojiufengensis]|uniref:MPT5 n=1 Tax=Candida pseudojiufengensis TaxID=497109 RepID=UPI0022250258|nr:MPT5 [Candida pseudojiufengensis]KAI5962407.1 MPT5 [Candida pseudojiufengensis]